MGEVKAETEKVDAAVGGAIGGIAGALPCCNCDWGSNGGACWSVDCEPCCGKPCNIVSGLKCLICWYFCFCCAGGKLYARSTEEKCAVVNHCVSLICCAPCVAILTRFNFRKKYGIGQHDLLHGIGDCLMIKCCPCCSMGQVLRSVPPEDWDWLPEMQNLNLFNDTCKVIRD